jgi:hypothetical protein
MDWTFVDLLVLVSTIIAVGGLAGTRLKTWTRRAEERERARLEKLILYRTRPDGTVYPIRRKLRFRKARKAHEADAAAPQGADAEQPPWGQPAKSSAARRERRAGGSHRAAGAQSISAAGWGEHPLYPFAHRLLRPRAHSGPAQLRRKLAERGDVAVDAGEDGRSTDYSPACRRTGADHTGLGVRWVVPPSARGAILPSDGVVPRAEDSAPS